MVAAASLQACFPSSGWSCQEAHPGRSPTASARTVQDEGILDRVAYEPPVPQEITDVALLQAIDQIPEDFRKPVLLADLHEFSYKEIAEILEIPVGTVMSRLNRGRKLFRMQLAGVAGSMGLTRQDQVDLG